MMKKFIAVTAMTVALSGQPHLPMQIGITYSTRIRSITIYLR